MPEDRAQTETTVGTANHDPKSADWLATAPTIADFQRLSEIGAYVPAPDDWLIGVADIVGSTDALAAGKYKAVNMVGAAVIAAVRNALGTLDFPFVFGGDGVTFLVAPDQRAQTEKALAACAIWSTEAMSLDLRVGLISVGDVRSASQDENTPSDVRVAWHAPSPNVRYAMFTGGGVGWAERALKRGDIFIPPAPPGTVPDLTDLSCRWAPIPTRQDQMVSLILLPAPERPPGAFASAADAVLKLLAQRLKRGGHPIPSAGPDFGFRANGIDLERRALFGTRRRWQDWWKLRFFYALAWLLLTWRLKLGDFDPERYRQETGENADFRKFEDGLKLTIDCDNETFAALEELLEEHAQQGSIFFGLSQQDSAIMTCIVPSANEADHIHFVDGAGGGYAAAASGLKARFFSARDGGSVN